MIDQQRVDKWSKDAWITLTQHYGKNDTAAHLAAVVLVLLADREDRERFISGKEVSGD